MTAAQEELQLQQETAAQVRGSLFMRLWGWWFSLFLLVPQAFAAPEAFCPGGSAPRSDVVWCAGFDDLDQCTTGQEAGCITDSGLTSVSTASIDGFKIKTCPYTSPITTSTGCIYGSGKASSTGPGYSSKTISPTLTTVSYRYYVLFGEGYLQNVTSTGNHGPGVYWDDDDADDSNGTKCTGLVSLDFTLSEPRAALQVNGADCNGDAATTFNPTTINIPMTGTDWVPKNGQWYRVEMKVGLNTTSSSDSAGNGTLLVTVDGVTLIERTNLNYRGASTTLTKIDEVYAARSFVGLGVASWTPDIHFTGFAISNDGTTLGASASEGSMGTGDASSPYWYTVAGDGAEQMKLASDCSAPGSLSKYVTSGWDGAWSGSPTFVTTPDHNEYACDAQCVGCTTTNSMKAQTTSSGTRAGRYNSVSNLNTTVNNTAVIHSWVYLDPANAYTTEIPFLGFARYCAGGGGGDDRCIAGIARNSSGKLVVVIYTDNTKGTTITSTTDLPTGEWVELQLAVTDANRISAQINGTWVIDTATPSQAISTWVFDDVSTGGQSVVFGILKDAPATEWNVYYDDMDAGGASFNDSKFWGDSSPFALTSTGTSSSGAAFGKHRRRRR